MRLRRSPSRIPAGPPIETDHARRRNHRRVESMAGPGAGDGGRGGRCACRRREFWRKVLSCDVDAGWFIDGLNQYTATPVVASQFAVQQTPPAFSYAGARYFAGFVPFVIRVPLRNATAGNGLADYRLNPGVDLRKPLRDARDRRSAAAKTALAMGTLERWIGAPTWDAVLQEFASRGWTTCPSPQDLGDVAREVTGLDLSWFFSQVFNSVDRFDYGIDALTSEPGVDRPAAYRTTVSVRRYGMRSSPGRAPARGLA